MGKTNEEWLEERVQEAQGRLEAGVRFYACQALPGADQDEISTMVEDLVGLVRAVVKQEMR